MHRGQTELGASAVSGGGGAGRVLRGRRAAGAGAAHGAARDEPDQREHLDPADRPDRRRHGAGGALRRLGAAGGAARRACCSSSSTREPWAWPRQLGTAASLLTMLMFVLVSVVAAQADWNPAGGQPGAGAGRWRAAWPRSPAWRMANRGSGTSWRQAFWTGCAMSPMSSVALLLVSQFVAVVAHAGRRASPASRCRPSC